MWKIPTSTDCLTLLDGSGDFNMLISELLRLAMVIQSPLPRVQVYIYIYMRIMLFIHIMFVLIVFNTCIYININTKIFSDSYCKEIDWKKLQVSWGCICCFLFQSKAQRSKGMGTWPDIQQSQVSVNCFGSLPLEASGFRAFLNCRTAWLKFWEVVICGG